MIPFTKYQGAGNDFILIDNREMAWSLARETVSQMCHRRFGIGADGLMLLQLHPQYDFEMIYYNSDGARSSMCGNGGRCIAAFAHQLGITKNNCRFLAFDGPHTAIKRDEIITLSMNDVENVQQLDNGAYVLHTGSPHYAVQVSDLHALDVKASGENIRFSEEYQQEGINVNFMQWEGDSLWVRTYERGVEDETLSCGTGVTAAAIATTYNQLGKYDLGIKTKGGDLRVLFTKPTPFSAAEVWLEGPALKVFEGIWPLNI